MTSDRGAGQDLRAYLTENGPLAPHSAALVVASLAEQLAVAHAEGSAYPDIGPETVHVVGPAPHMSVSVSAPLIPLNDTAMSADVRALGILLAWLLDATPPDGRPEGTPAVLWRVVESCTSADVAKRPGAALLARMLRDAARDLLLGVAPGGGAGAGPAAAAPPRYLPTGEPALEPPRRPRSRWTGRALLVGATSVLAIALAGTGILLPTAGMHLPFPKGGLVQAASRGIPAASPSGPATAAGQAATGIGAATSDPPSPPPDPMRGTPTDAPAGPAPADATPSPPPPAPPPAGEPTPPPGTGYRTSDFDVPTSRLPDVRGRLIWYARSVGVSAVISSSGRCAAAVFTGYSGSTQVARIATIYRCGNVTISQNLNGRTTPEGITQVIVDLYVGGTLIGRDNCLRSTARCTGA